MFIKNAFILYKNIFQIIEVIQNTRNETAHVRPVE